MDIFSFDQSDSYNILIRANALVPGIAKVMSISCTKDSDAPEVFVLDSPGKNSKPEQLMPDGKALAIIKSIQKEKTNFFWYDDDEMPFSVNNPDIKPLNVFTELDKNILMVSAANEFGKAKDLYFFYFNENISNFTITHSQRTLTQENKLIVGFLLYNAINTILEVLRKDKKAFLTFRKGVNHVIEDMETAKATIEGLREKHDDVMFNYAIDLVQELSASLDFKTIEFSKKACEKIRKYDGDISSLREAIKNALLFAGSMHIGEKKSKLLIHDFQLHLDAIKAVPAKKEAPPTASRKEKVAEWLDKLETAVVTAKEKELSLTGNNVGDQFETHLSAPAITLHIKKYHVSIKDLCETHQDKWVVARTEFKPLMNILTTRFSDDSDVVKKKA